MSPWRGRSPSCSAHRLHDLVEGVGWLLVPAYGVALAGLVAWGAYWRGWPQFSALGWI